MANINNLIGCAHYIHVHALQLVQQSAEVIESVHQLQREAAEANLRVPRGLGAEIDIRNDNELMDKTYGTADIAIQMNEVMDILVGLIRRTTEDIRRVNRRLGRPRRRRDDQDVHDDDIAFVQQQQQQQLEQPQLQQQ